MTTPWLDTKEYPFLPRFWDHQGYKMHYIDEGIGPVLLFVHGTPSWSFDWRYVIADLKNNFRCIAIDHIGFGLSAKPTGYDYSTFNHSKTLESFVIEKNLENITLVVHDFGGPIGLHMAIRQSSRISRLVILNAWLWSAEKDPDYIKLKRVLKSPILPFLYRYLNFSPRFILPAAFGDQKISGHIKKQYTKPFHKINEREGPLAFARSLLHDQAWFESLWAQKHSIDQKPALFIWGMKDPVIRPHYLEKFQSGFPNSTTFKLPTAGHFPQEEQPKTVSKEIRNFINAHKN